jgi:hypothetical protein
MVSSAQPSPSRRTSSHLRGVVGRIRVPIRKDGFPFHSVWNMPDIFFPSRFKFMSGIFQVYTTHILSESFGNMPGINLDYFSACKSASKSNAIHPDAAAVTVHVFWVSRVVNIQRQMWQARMATPERQQMQPYVAQHRL